MNTLETAIPYQPAPAVPAPEISAVMHEAVDRVHDMARAALVHAQTAFMPRGEHAAEGPRWMRAVQRLGVVGVGALAIIGGRATGAAAHIVDALPVGGGGGTGASLLDFNEHVTEAVHHAVPHGASAASHHELTLTAHTVKADGPALPADLNKAPDLGPLRKYNPHNGAGTVWHQMEVYAKDMGYEVSETQKRVLTGRELHRIGETWSSSHDLQPGYKPNLPSQHTMQSWLHEAGAHRTHTPDRAVIVTPPAGSGTSAGTHPAPGSTTPTPAPSMSMPGHTMPGQAMPAPHVPFYDREIVHIPEIRGVNWAYVGIAAAEVALLPVATYLDLNRVERAIGRYRARRELDRADADQALLDDSAFSQAATAEHPIVTDGKPQHISTAKTVPSRAWTWRERRGTAETTPAAAVPPEAVATPEVAPPAVAGPPYVVAAPIRRGPAPQIVMPARPEHLGDVIAASGRDRSNGDDNSDAEQPVVSKPFWQFRKPSSRPELVQSSDPVAAGRHTSPGRRIWPFTRKQEKTPVA